MALLDEGRRLVSAADWAGLTVRLVGGVAVLAHCPTELDHGGSREIADLDAVVESGEERALTRVLVEVGYHPETRFNALHGDRRLLFAGPLGRLDVMVGKFEMCNRLEVSARLKLDHPTLTVSDLLLTKLQVVQLNEKDGRDALSLLADHESSSGEGDVINIRYLGSTLAADWGLWRTVTGTLARLREMSQDHVVSDRIDAIESAIEAAPKTLRFKLRAKVGERFPWYVLPDEVEQE